MKAFMKAFIIAGALLVSTAVFGQQPPPDPVFLQYVLASLQAQRNQAMDASVVSDAKTATVQAELDKAKARIKELEAKNRPEEKTPE